MSNQKNTINNIQADIILKTWNEIPKQIELFRKNALDYENNKKSTQDNKSLNNIDDYNQTQFYNNISILGGRGTGKTSLLMKLRQDIIDKENSDIIFDIITPDINHKEDILGWIISLVIEQVKSREKKLLKKGCFNSNCRVFDDNIKSNIEKYVHELRQDYFFRKSIYEQLIAKDYTGRIEYLKNNEEKLNADVRLSKSFKRLIDESRNILKVDEEPLFIFVFDDVDIHAEKINEVLSTIMTYLSHPNIVTIIAADYESALENVTLKMLKQDGILDNNLIERSILSEYEKTLLERREERAYDFLKKVIPPMYRHKIYPLSNDKKYEIIKKELNTKNYNKSLDKILRKIDEDFITYYPDKYSKDKPIKLYDYMSFLDNTIRGISNVIRFIESRNISEEFINGDKKAKFDFLKELLELIIDSNKDLRLNGEIIRKVINLSQNNKEYPNKSTEGLKFNGYINYYAIVGEIEKDKRKDVLQENRVLTELEFKSYYNIFMLGNLFEVIIIVLKLRYENEYDNTKHLDKLHGLNEIKFILNNINDNDVLPRLVPNIENNVDNREDIQEIICIKQNIFSALKYHEIKQLFKEKNSGYLESIYIDSFNHKVSVVEYLGNIFRQDREWSSKVADWIINNSPSDENIKDKIIKELEQVYEYTIDIYNDSQDKIDEYFLDNSILWNVSTRLSSLIREYIDNISMFKIVNVQLRSILVKINFENEKLKDLQIRKDKIIKKSNNTSLENQFVDIENIINQKQHYIDDPINKEMWNSIEPNIVVDVREEQRGVLEELRNKVLLIDLKKTLNEYSEIDKDYINKIENISILIKNEFMAQNDKIVKFVEEYYTSIMIIKELKKHPSIEYHSIMHNEKEVKNLIKDLKKEKTSLKYYIEMLNQNFKNNEIYKYTLIKNNLVDKNQQDVHQAILDLENRNLEEYTTSFIYSVINFYTNYSTSIKSINFEYLLEDFIKEINILRGPDKKIIEHIEKNMFNLSQMEKKFYIEKFKSIQNIVSISDIEKLKMSIIKVKNEEISKLEALLNIKENDIKDSVWNLKNDIFKKAFNVTVSKYVQAKLEESHKELYEKVRTQYLSQRREELKNLCALCAPGNANEQNTDFTGLLPFIREMQSKYEFLRNLKKN